MFLKLMAFPFPCLPDRWPPLPRAFPSTLSVAGGRGGLVMLQHTNTDPSPASQSQSWCVAEPTFPCAWSSQIARMDLSATGRLPSLVRSSLPVNIRGALLFSTGASEGKERLLGLCSPSPCPLCQPSQAGQSPPWLLQQLSQPSTESGGTRARGRSRCGLGPGSPAPGAGRGT